MHEAAARCWRSTIGSDISNIKVLRSTIELLHHKKKLVDQGVREGVAITPSGVPVRDILVSRNRFSGLLDGHEQRVITVGAGTGSQSIRIERNAAWSPPDDRFGGRREFVNIATCSNCSVTNNVVFGAGSAFGNGDLLVVKRGTNSRLVERGNQIKVGPIDPKRW